MPRSSALFTATAALFAVSAACGARTGLPLGSEACTGVPLGIVKQVPNLYFMLDRSGSMTEGMPEKWTVVRQEVASLITSLGAEADFGAAAFPAPSKSDFCLAGDEILSLRPGDGLPSTDASSVAAAFLRATAAAPLGGTPTAATFLARTPELVNFSGHTFAILATDGGPNCNEALTCGPDTCTLNIDGRTVDKVVCPAGGPLNCCDPSTYGPTAPESCLDGDRTVAAIAALAARGVPTYIVGVPGSEAYASVLDSAAMAGGTARASEPFYYPVDTSSSSSLVDALANIAARIAASCTLLLERSAQPGVTNVVIDGAPVAASGPNGWTLSGDVVTLLGATCDSVRTEGQKVVVTEGCDTLR